MKYGLYAHHRFHPALRDGEAKLEIHENRDRAEGDLVPFRVRSSMATTLWDKHFKAQRRTMCTGTAWWNPIRIKAG